MKFINEMLRGKNMEHSKDVIKNQLESIKNQIREAEEKSARKAGSVKLEAVSKFHPLQAVLDAIDLGQFLFGENRVQEACEKFEQVKEMQKNFQLHIIGSLQRNKVKNAVKIADCIESVDRLELLEEIEKQCEKIGKKINVFFELHTGEDSKSGFENVDELQKALDFCAEMKNSHIIPKGFMTMAPFTDNEKLIHSSFATLRKVSEEMKVHYPQFDFCELSMGMSGDYKIAIEEGSTLVRIGTAIFGERNY